MARPLRIEFEGAAYHITARGNERGEIYRDDKDREKHIEILKTNKERYGIKINAYVLMGNHFHLLVGTPEGNLTSFMHAAQAHYSNYYNRRHGRAGHLFQGRYKALIVDADSYFLELSRYIHLNPVRAGLTKKPENWRWSSYRAYLTGGEENEWVNAEEVLAYFGKRRSRAAIKYREMVETAIMSDEMDQTSNPTESPVAQLILGGDAFVAKIKGILEEKSGKRPDARIRELPSARRLRRWDDNDALVAVASIAEYFGVDESEILQTRKKNNFPRAAAMIVFRERSRWTIGEIGSYFGVSYSAVSNYLSGFRREIDSNRKAAKQIAELERIISV